MTTTSILAPHVVLSTALAALVTLAAPPAARAGGYTGSSFNDVWDQVASDPYAELPHHAVTLSSFFHGFTNKLLQSSNRTLDSHADLLPWFKKLLHPNGICLAGTWHITEETELGGYFRGGNEGLIIARASTALTETRADQYRVFAFAGKIFPTLDPDEVVPTANFVSIEDLGGTLRDHFLDARMTNDIIVITLRPSSVFRGPLAFTVGVAFATADHTFDVTQTLVRQLYPIAEAGDAATGATAPRWMRISGAADTPRVDAADFRDELRIEHYPGGILFDIEIADDGTRLGAKDWRTIGYLHFTATVASDSCDHRLHFHHPRHR